MTTPSPMPDPAADDAATWTLLRERHLRFARITGLVRGSAGSRFGRARRADLETAVNELMEHAAEIDDDLRGAWVESEGHVPEPVLNAGMTATVRYLVGEMRGLKDEALELLNEMQAARRALPDELAHLSLAAAIRVLLEQRRPNLLDGSACGVNDDGVRGEPGAQPVPRHARLQPDSRRVVAVDDRDVGWCIADLRQRVDAARLRADDPTTSWEVRRELLARARTLEEVAAVWATQSGRRSTH